MYLTHRLCRWRALLWLVLTASPAWWAVPAEAVSITGIMVYSSDDWGNPSGVDTFTQGNFEAQMWRTLALGDKWHSLAVIQGLPPEKVNDPFLNFPNFTVDLPLDEGENYFTLVGEPGVLTATDDYQRFVVNLYFDGDESRPGVSVLFPRMADPDGSPVEQSRANEDQIYSMLLEKAEGPPRSFHDDGVYRVSVLRASLLPPDRANVSVDRMMPRGLGASGTSDWVGSLVVMVEPSEAFGPAGGPAVPAAGGGGGGGGRTGTSGSGVAPGAGVPAGYVPPGPLGGPGVAGRPELGYEDGSGGGGEPDKFWHEGDKHEDSAGDEAADADGTPTPADLVNALQQWLSAAATQTPGGDGEESAEAEGTPAPTQHGASTATPQSKTPADDLKGTPTPAKTPATGTPSPASTPSQSPAATTPTPAAAKTPQAK